jgi:hypothetical protein
MSLGPLFISPVDALWMVLSPPIIHRHLKEALGYRLVTPIFKDKNRMHKVLMSAPGHDRTHK